MIDIACVTFGHSPIQLRHHLDSLVLQTDHRFHEFIVHDGSPSSTDEEARKSAEITRKTILPYLQEYPSLFSYHELDERQGCWGHRGREYAMALINAPYFMMMNADNIYVAQWCQRVHEALEENDVDLLMWPILHNYFAFSLHAPVISPEPRLNCIDFANFCIRSTIGKSLGFPYVDRAADGIWIEDIVANTENLRVGRIPLVLAIHY